MRWQQLLRRLCVLLDKVFEGGAVQEAASVSLLFFSQV